MYKVQFVNVASGKGFIDGYKSARRAREVVLLVNASTEKTGIQAVYLGKHT